MKIIKKIFCVVIIFSICFDTFGAVVSGNDGNAFINKSEFDNMKENFASQIDQYNDSLDNKIDGAIASYIAGITVSSVLELKNQITELEKGFNKKIYWTNKDSDIDCWNISRFNISITYSLSTKQALCRYTKHFAYNLNAYNNGYKVMNKKDGYIIKETAYNPKLIENVTYIYITSESDTFGASMASWSAMTYFGNNQNYNFLLNSLQYM